MKNKSWYSIPRLIRAFGYSIEGLKDTFITEAAFRLEIILSAFIIPWIFVMDITNVEKSILLFSIFLIIVAELVNTAIEATIDRISKDIHPLSKKAKDVASAVVLVACINAAFVWVAIFFG